jgi:hypothetical protein
MRGWWGGEGVCLYRVGWRRRAGGNAQSRVQSLLSVCLSVCLSVGLSGALVSWAVLHVELGDGGRAGSTRHTARAHDVPGCCCCK